MVDDLDKELEDRQGVTQPSKIPIFKTKEQVDAWELAFPDKNDAMDYKEEQAYFSSLEYSNHPDLARLQFHVRMGNLWESAGTMLAKFAMGPHDLTE